MVKSIKKHRRGILNNHSKPFSAIFLVLAVCFIISILPQVSAFNWNDGLVSYYDLDSNSFLDSTSNNNDGVNYGSTNISGILEDGRYVDGINDFINFSVDPYNQPTTTISFWTKIADEGATRYIICPSGTGSWKYQKIGITDASYPFFSAGNGVNAYTNLVSNTTITVDEWTHIVVTFIDGVNATIWTNGDITANASLIDYYNLDDMIIGLSDGNSNYYNSSVDEIAVFNRSLTQIEITELYNGGDGLSYGETGLIELSSPINGTTISDIGTNFTVEGGDVSAYNANWTNITYYVWNGTILHNSTSIDFADVETFDQSLFIDEFTLGSYVWNAKACYTNITGDYCIMADNNNTFNVVPFTILNTDYDENVFEGSLESFSTNVSIISLERLSTVSFIYNGTSYASYPVEYTTNEYYIPQTINIPEIDTNENVSFYWSISLESGLVYNTTAMNQTIYNAGIDDCSVYTNQIFNLTIRDETSQNVLDGATDNTSIKVDIDLLSNNGIEIISFSKFYNETNPARVCLNYPMNESKLRMDAVIEYTRSGGFVEFYNIQNYELTNETQSQNISLYSLLESEGQEYKIIYKGLDFIPVSDLVVQIQRKYIDEGVFKTIEIPMSGTNGYTIAHLITNDVVYNLIFIKDGVILDSFMDVIATCQNPTFTECEINLNALVSGTNLFDLIEDNDFFSSFSYTPETRTMSSTFGIPSGTSGNVSLQVFLLDNFGNTSVCNDNLLAAGGSLSCSIPESFGNSTIYAKLLLDNEIKREGFISMNIKPGELYGGSLIFLSVIMVLFLIGMAVQENPMITGVFLILGVFILVGVNLIYSPTLIGAGATILWFVVAVIMILIKGGNKR